MSEKSQKEVRLLLLIVTPMVILFYGLKIYGVDITPISYQKHFKNHEKIGQKLHFSQPIVYIVRKNPSTVPIVDAIQKELEGLHSVGLYDEKINQYISSKTVFTITDVYAYATPLSEKTFWYVLSDEKGIKYIAYEGYLKWLTEPSYPNAQVPLDFIDELYLSKNTMKIKFLALNEHNEYLTQNYFKKCKVKDFIFSFADKKAIVIATVDFTQMVCLYDDFWRGAQSWRNPISYEIIKQE